jgi:hypothetical protein
MKAGILLPQVGDSTTRQNVLYIAKEAEREELNSIWVLERLLWPLKPKTLMLERLMVLFRLNTKKRLKPVKYLPTWQAIPTNFLWELV